MRNKKTERTGSIFEAWSCEAFNLETPAETILFVDLPFFVLAHLRAIQVLSETTLASLRPSTLLVAMAALFQVRLRHRSDTGPMGRGVAVDGFVDHRCNVFTFFIAISGVAKNEIFRFLDCIKRRQTNHRQQGSAAMFQRRLRNLRRVAAACAAHGTILYQSSINHKLDFSHSFSWI